MFCSKQCASVLSVPIFLWAFNHEHPISLHYSFLKQRSDSFILGVNMNLCHLGCKMHCFTCWSRNFLRPWCMNPIRAYLLLSIFRRRDFGWSIKKIGVIGIMENFVQTLTFSLVNQGIFWDTAHQGLVRQWVNWIVILSRETNRTTFHEYVAELFETHTSSYDLPIVEIAK
jgi:hypothetical protein